MRGGPAHRAYGHCGCARARAATRPATVHATAATIRVMRSVRAHQPSALALALAAAGALTPGPGVTADNCQDGLRAADVVPATLLSGPHHRVDPCVAVDGHLVILNVQSEHGDLQVAGLGLLETRVAELDVLDTLSRTSSLALAGRAATASVGDAARAVGQVVRRPVATIEGLPGGLARFVRTRFGEAGRRVREIGDDAGDGLTGADEAYDRVAVRPGVAPTATPPPTPWWQRGAEQGGRLARDLIGYDDARRTWSQRLGVDPYTTNPLLDARLDTLAWAALGGEQAVGLATGQLGTAAGNTLRYSTRINRIVWELPASEVAERNGQRLDALGCGGLEMRRFLRNRSFDPTRQTALVDALIELAPAEGCLTLLELAAAIDAEPEVRFLADAMLLLAAHGERGGELRLVGNTPVLALAPTGADGGTPPLRRDRLLLPLPVDVLTWTAETAAFFDDPAFRVVDKRVLLDGRATTQALRGLTRRGWYIEELAGPAELDWAAATAP
jgi:hypothetical protein